MPALQTAEQWLANNPSWAINDKQRQSLGPVLYVAPDGVWIQKLGREVAIRPPTGFSIAVGDVIEIDKNGKARKIDQDVDKELDK